METRHLKYFVAVAEELHFGKAAKRLHISQPPLSQQIMKFEDELGVTLFERSKRAVFLTSAGKGFLPEAQKILKDIEQAKTKLQAVATGTGGHLGLGYIAPALETPLIEIIKRFKSNCPGVQLGLTEMPTTRQLDALRSGDIDVAIVRLFHHDTDGLLCFKFHQESYALVLPKSHRFQSQTSVNIAELAEEDLIFFPRHLQPRLYDAWMNVFSSYGFSPKIVQEVATKAASMALAAAGIGISIVPESLGQRALKEVIFKPLIGDFPTLEMHVVYKENTVHAGRDNFIKIADPTAFRL